MPQVIEAEESKKSPAFADSLDALMPLDSGVANRIQTGPLFKNVTKSFENVMQSLLLVAFINRFVHSTIALWYIRIKT